MPKLDSKIVTLLFPARCLGCDAEIPQALDQRADVRDHVSDEKRCQQRKFDFRSAFEIHWCRRCWDQLRTQSNVRCFKCGATITGNNLLGDRCALCWELDLRFARSVSIDNYRGLLQDLVIRMKNQYDEQLAIQLANVLAQQLLGMDFVDDLNLVTPVPTHWFRRFRRGFSAAEVLAEQLALAADIPYSNHVLKCLRTTKKQGTLSTSGRIKNVRGAFGIRPKTSVTGLTILLVDDVMTSGATVSELARVLLREGATKVYVGVVARGARVR